LLFMKRSMTSATDHRRNSISWCPRASICRSIALIWAAALLIGSLQPMRPAHFHFSMAHHVAHFVAFGALAFLSIVGFDNRCRIALGPATAALLLGFMIEFLQHLQNRMPIEWYDVRDDAFGVIVFAALCHMAYRRRSGLRNTSLQVNEVFLSDRA
jgi:hypothetical protein